MKAVFLTDDVHARDRVEYWREHASKAAVAHDFDSPVGQQFRGSILAGKLGPLSLSVLEHDAGAVRRTDYYVRRGAEDDLLLSLVLDGGLALRQDGREATVRPNELYILDSGRPFSLDIGRSLRLLLVKVPRGELQCRLGDLRALMATPINNGQPLAALATGFLSMLPDRVGALNAGVGSQVAQQMLDLVALAFGQQLRDGKVTLASARMRTLLRLKTIIETRLGNPGLRPTHVAEAAGISVRYANALLAHEGMSLERLIMLRRLQHCRLALEDAAQARRTVSDIAYSLGFSNMSHFTRRFRSQFGCAPSECRQRALTASSGFLVLPQDA